MAALFADERESAEAKVKPAVLFAVEEMLMASVFAGPRRQRTMGAIVEELIIAWPR